MKLKEMMELGAKLMPQHAEREVACVCALCDCETFVGANPKTIDHDPAAVPVESAGNCDRLIFLPDH